MTAKKVAWLKPGGMAVDISVEDWAAARGGGVSLGYGSQIPGGRKRAQ